MVVTSGSNSEAAKLICACFSVASSNTLALRWGAPTANLAVDFIAENVPD
jgi:hypothetical protein